MLYTEEWMDISCSLIKDIRNVRSPDSPDVHATPSAECCDRRVRKFSVGANDTHCSTPSSLTSNNAIRNAPCPPFALLKSFAHSAIWGPFRPYDASFTPCASPSEDTALRPSGSRRRPANRRKPTGHRADTTQTRSASGIQFTPSSSCSLFRGCSTSS